MLDAQSSDHTETLPDQDLLDHLGEINYLCMVDAGQLFLDLSVKERPTGLDPKNYILNGIEYRSFASCQQFTGFALDHMIQDRSYYEFKRVIPFCTQQCDNPDDWTYHFLLLIQLPTGNWTYLSTGNYSRETIELKLAFDGISYSNLQSLLFALEVKFKVKYPVDEDSIA